MEIRQALATLDVRDDIFSQAKTASLTAMVSGRETAYPTQPGSAL